MFECYFFRFELFNQKLRCVNVLAGRGTFRTLCISSRSSGLHVSMVLYGLIRAAQVVAHEVEAMHSHAWFEVVN